MLLDGLKVIEEERVRGDRYLGESIPVDNLLVDLDIVVVSLGD